MVYNTYMVYTWYIPSPNNAQYSFSGNRLSTDLVLHTLCRTGYVSSMEQNHVLQHCTCQVTFMISTAAMCPTTQCTTCWRPRDQLDNTQDSFHFTDTGAVEQDEQQLLLKQDGTLRDRCKDRVSQHSLALPVICSVIYLLYNMCRDVICHVQVEKLEIFSCTVTALVFPCLLGSLPDAAAGALI
jgi:hypothetical protein